MADQWSYRLRGKQFGPVSFQRLKELVELGVVEPGSDVREEGMSEWIPAAEVGGLMSSQSSVVVPDNWPNVAHKERQGNDNQAAAVKGNKRLYLSIGIGLFLLLIGTGIVVTLTWNRGGTDAKKIPKHEPDLTALQGKWKVTRFEVDGVVPTRNGIGSLMLFENNGIWVQENAKAQKEKMFSYAISSPPAIKVWEGEIKMEGRYEIDKELLTIEVGPTSARQTKPGKPKAFRDSKLRWVLEKVRDSQDGQEKVVVAEKKIADYPPLKNTIVGRWQAQDGKGETCAVEFTAFGNVIAVKPDHGTGKYLVHDDGTLDMEFTRSGQVETVKSHAKASKDELVIVDKENRQRENMIVMPATYRRVEVFSASAKPTNVRELILGRWKRNTDKLGYVVSYDFQKGGTLHRMISGGTGFPDVFGEPYEWGWKDDLYKAKGLLVSPGDEKVLVMFPKADRRNFTQATATVKGTELFLKSYPSGGIDDFGPLGKFERVKD